MSADMKLIKDLEKVIGGKPIEDIAPLLVVAVARMLVIDAGGDSAKMGFLLAKFLRLLTDTIEEMFNDPNEGRLH